MPHDASIDPFSQLERCHRRLEEACAALEEAVPKRDLETIGDVAAFLGRQIRRHEDDEDASLFPRLERLNHAELAPTLARLRAEHLEHEKLRTELEDALSGRVAEQWTALGEVSANLIRSYRAHIALEESAVFPLARQQLGAEDVAALRSEMDARRGR